MDNFPVLGKCLLQLYWLFIVGGEAGERGDPEEGIFNQVAPAGSLQNVFVRLGRLGVMNPA